MNRTVTGVTAGAGLMALAFVMSGAIGSTQPSATGLPGARPAIDASTFPSLQAAFDAIPEDGGIVRLPAGTFEITRPLVISRGDVLVQGAGTATHIVNRNEDGQPALILQHPDGADVEKDQRLWRIMLSNFRVTGNEKSGHGILATQIQEVFIQGVTVSENGGDGIRLDHCYEDPRVNDCLITYNKDVGLNLLGCHDIVVASNQFEENNDALHCVDGFNLCMTGNCLDDHLQHGVVIENTYGSVVSGNMIEECNGTAIILDRDCYGNTLSANVIAHNGAGVDLRDAHGCAVSANTFTIMKTDALRIGPDSGRITVTGNNFSNSYIGDGVKRGTEDLAAAGLKLEGTRDVAISGNLFSSLRPMAVEVTGEPTRRVAFTGNVLTDTQSDHGKVQDSLIDNVLKSQ
jgi:parallel beta-helix repeat protein